MGYVLTPEDFSNWLDDYGRCWKQHDGRNFANKFVETGIYTFSRFWDPARGRQAIESEWVGLVVKHEIIKFSYQLLVCEGATGICKWEAILNNFAEGPDRVRQGHSGILYCRFSTSQYVESLEDWHEVVFNPS